MSRVTSPPELFDESGRPLPADPIDDHHEEPLEEDDEVQDDDNEAEDTTEENPRVAYPHLREISSLASWTVSSHKPGCGVAALRNPSTALFWQSDGPQPHTLTLHFAKRVTIAHMRLHVDQEHDESYTPTRIQIWAGTGYHDLLCVTEMNLDSPKGWLAVDLSNAGGPSEFDVNEEDIDYEPSADAVEDLGNSEDDRAVVEQLIRQGNMIPRDLVARQQKRKRMRIGRGPTLRCFLVQVRILENNQNGKDTHLRGFQVFAKDHEAVKIGRHMLSREEHASSRRPKEVVKESNDAAKERKERRRRKADWLFAGLEKAHLKSPPELR